MDLQQLPIAHWQCNPVPLFICSFFGFMVQRIWCNSNHVKHHIAMFIAIAENSLFSTINFVSSSILGDVFTAFLATPLRIFFLSSWQVKGLDISIEITMKIVKDSSIPVAKDSQFLFVIGTT